MQRAGWTETERNIYSEKQTDEPFGNMQCLPNFAAFNQVISKLNIRKVKQDFKTLDILKMTKLQKGCN